MVQGDGGGMERGKEREREGEGRRGHIKTSTVKML